MNITLDKNTNVNALIKVQLQETDYKPLYSKKLKDVAAKATIKGFRPGKVPTSMVERMYGKGVLAEVIDDMLNTHVSAYIKDNNLKIVGQPLPTVTQDDNNLELNSGKDYNFDFEIGLVPDLNLPSPKDVSVDAYAITITDADVAKQTQELLKRNGTTSNPEVSVMGDLVYGTLSKPGTEFTTNTAIPSDKVLEAEQSKFVGVKKGDTILFDIEKALTHGDIHHVTGLSHTDTENFSGAYQLEVTNVNRTGVAELNEEFFNKIFPGKEITTEEAFTAKLKEDMQAVYATEAESFKEALIQKHYVDNFRFELASDFLKKFLKDRNEKITDEELNKEYPSYENFLRWQLIQNDILEKADLKIDNADVLEAAKSQMKEQFAQYGIASLGEDQLEEFAKSFLFNKESKGKNYNDMAERAVRDKVFTYLAQNINLKTQEVSFDAFNDKVKDFNQA